MSPVCIKCILFLFLFSHIASTLVCISAIIIIIIVSSASLPQVSVLLPLKFAWLVSSTTDILNTNKYTVTDVAKSGPIITCISSPTDLW